MDSCARNHVRKTHSSPNETQALTVGPRGHDLVPVSAGAEVEGGENGVAASSHAYSGTPERRRSSNRGAKPSWGDDRAHRACSCIAVAPVTDTAPASPIPLPLVSYASIAHARALIAGAAACTAIALMRGGVR